MINQVRNATMPIGMGVQSPCETIVDQFSLNASDKWDAPSHTPRL